MFFPHVHVCTYASCVCAYTPGGLLRKPPLKCAGASCPRFPRRSLTRIRPRADLRSPGAVIAHNAQRHAHEACCAVKDLCARPTYVRSKRLKSAVA